MKMEKVLRSALLLLLAAALCLSMAACTQTPAESSPVSETQTPETAASEKASPEDDMPEDAGTEETPASDALSSALPVKTLRAKRVDENPYMAKSDANIHHDGYNTDSTDEVLPLGIYPEINVSYEKTNANASPAIYFDSYGHAVVPLLGGIAIRDLNAEETKTLGYFSPKQHDGGGYVIQSSYTFLDSENRIVDAQMRINVVAEHHVSAVGVHAGMARDDPAVREVDVFDEDLLAGAQRLDVVADLFAVDSGGERQRIDRKRRQAVRRLMDADLTLALAARGKIFHFFGGTQMSVGFEALYLLVREEFLIRRYFVLRLVQTCEDTELDIARIVADR